MKTVLVLMAISGICLAAYSLKLHEHLLSADEPQARHACRHLCTLGLMDFADLGDSSLGAVARAVASRACASMDDETPLLLECRDRLTGLGISVATYRCIVAATTPQDAHACDEDLK